MNRREALRELGSGATLGALFGTALVIVQCQPVEAPAAEPDPLLALINEYRTARNHADAMPDGSRENDETFSAYLTGTVDPLFWRLANETPQATTAAGALAALKLMREGVFTENGEAAFDKPLLMAAMQYLERRAT